MYQISYSIRMINELENDLVKNEKRWNKVYFTAIIVSLIFTVGVAFGECDFVSENNDQLNALYISMCSAYFLLSITYTVTIIFLRKNMRELLEGDENLDAERKSVLY